MAKSTVTAQEKKDHARFTALYGQSCNGVQISVFDMGKVMRVGLDAIRAGLDDEGVKAKLVEFVSTIRKN